MIFMFDLMIFLFILFYLILFYCWRFFILFDTKKNISENVRRYVMRNWINIMEGRFKRHTLKWNWLIMDNGHEQDIIYVKVFCSVSRKTTYHVDRCKCSLFDFNTRLVVLKQKLCTHCTYLKSKKFQIDECQELKIISITELCHLWQVPLCKLLQNITPIRQMMKRLVKILFLFFDNDSLD